MQIRNLQGTQLHFDQQDQLEASISPITNVFQPHMEHEDEKEQMNAYKNFVKKIETLQRKKSIQKSHQIKNNVLQTQIQSKNYRHQLQNNISTQEKYKFSDFLENKNYSKIKINRGSQKKIILPSNQKCETIDIKREQEKNKKQQFQLIKGKPYVEKKNLARKPLVLDKQKQNTSKQPKLFQQIKLRVLKLPQLNSENPPSKKQIKQNPKIQEFKNIQVAIKQKKAQKLQSNFITNPIMKTYDTRHFGIDCKSSNYEKMGKNLLTEIRKKYWCYDNLENEEVYDNFENLLISELPQRSLKFTNFQ